ncbi:MAG: FmdB family zinc ribbon protein [Thermoplasmatota archaeon]
MVKCPDCGKEYDIPIGEMADKSCPNCGEDLLKELPGFPNRRGRGSRNTVKIGWDILKKNFRKIIIFLLVPTIILTVVNWFTFWEIVVPAFSNLAPETSSYYATADHSTFDLVKGLAIGGGVSSSYWILQHIFMGGIVRMSRDSYIGRIVSPKKGLKEIKNRFLDLIGASILTTLLLLGSFFISLLIGIKVCCFGSVGILISVFLFIVILYWIIFTYPILILNGKGVIDSILSSRKLSISRKGTLKFTFVVFFIYYTFSWFFAGLVQFAFSASFFKKSIYHLVLQMGLQSLVIFLQLLVLAFSFICITVHYLKIEENDEGKEAF